MAPTVPCVFQVPQRAPQRIAIRPQQIGHGMDQQHIHPAQALDRLAGAGDHGRHAVFDADGLADDAERRGCRIAPEPLRPGRNWRPYPGRRCPPPRPAPAWPAPPPAAPGPRCWRRHRPGRTAPCQGPAGARDLNGPRCGAGHQAGTQLARTWRKGRRPSDGSARHSRSDSSAGTGSLKPWPSAVKPWRMRAITGAISSGSQQWPV